MTTNAFNHIGVGLYTVCDASRLSHVSASRIRRWLRGYTFTTKSGLHKSPPVVDSPLPSPDPTVLILNFLDLQETMFVNAFIDAGVKWKTLRIAHTKAARRLGPHPFSRGKFVTDGRQIFEDLVPNVGDAAFVNMVSDQMAFKRTVLPYVVKLDFSAKGQAERWWPLGKNRKIVVDPQRAFGQPIVAREGVPTLILAKAYRVEQSFIYVARWFDVNERSVRDAVEFEETLAA